MKADVARGGVADGKITGGTQLKILVMALLTVSAAAAAAQPARPSAENVTVTGTKSREVLEKFVESFAAPARMTGKLSRWEDGICPAVVGLPAGFTKFVTQRVKEVAAKVGAPVNEKEPCGHNIAIVFTAAPQALLDKIRKRQPWFLGYADSSAQIEKLATVTRPIQAWYMTATKDWRGNSDVDTAKGGGVDLTVQAFLEPTRIMPMTMPYAHFRNVTGWRIDDGQHSAFYDVIIVVDQNKLVDYEIGAIADYISMLALAQLNALDTCQQLPSIVNMLAVGCERKVDALTDNDIAYLRGLYKMSPDRTLRTEQDEIAYQMGQHLKGH
jgi:hypothetical protein